MEGEEQEEEQAPIEKEERVEGDAGEVTGWLTGCLTVDGLLAVVEVADFNGGHNGLKCLFELSIFANNPIPVDTRQDRCVQANFARHAIDKSIN